MTGTHHLQRLHADNNVGVIGTTRRVRPFGVATGKPNIHAQLGESQYEDVIARWPESDEEVALSTIDPLKQHRVAWMGGFGSADDSKVLARPTTIEKTARPA